MSIRIMADGKTYDRTDCREVRTCIGAEPKEGARHVCANCGGFIHRVTRWPPVNGVRGTVAIHGYAHNPGTFWENDMPRWR